jgi:hypothetical protein
MVAILSLALVMSCKGQSSVKSLQGPRGEGGSGGTAGASALGPCGVPDPALAELNADELFNYPHVPTFDIHLPDSNWEALKQDARDEEYVEAEACFEGRAIGRVGLRFKGAVGSLEGCFNAQDEMTCRKLSMKLKFSEYDQDQRFYGLKRLNFNANQGDDSRMKEKLALDLYRSMGIVTPRASWAVVRVNDESQGLYGMVEQVDGRFTKNRWPDNPDGNLYKELWPSHTDLDYITAKLKTNKEIGNVSAFAAFAQAMTAASEAGLRDTLAEYMDLTYLERVLAVGDAILDYDGLTYFWTDGVSSSNHNYYLYEESPHRFTLIPWDVEATFWLNPDHEAPHWTVLPDDCTETYSYWGGLAFAAGCDVVFRAMAADLSGWRAAGEELLNGPFAEQAMLDAIDRHANFIRTEAEADPTPSVYDDFNASVERLRALIPTLRSRFENLLAGMPWEPLALTVGITDFEIHSDATLLGPGSWLGADAESTVGVSINTVDPMSGDRDFLMSFEYANEAEPWEQWAIYLVPLSGGTNDLSPLTGVRMMARADQTRTLRLNIDGSHASAANDHARYGWDVALTDQPTPIELLFAEAALSPWRIEQEIDPGYTRADALTVASGFTIEPQCVGCAPSGMLPDGTTDEGFVQLDDIELF